MILKIDFTQACAINVSPASISVPVIVANEPLNVAGVCHAVLVPLLESRVVKASQETRIDVEAKQCDHT